MNKSILEEIRKKREFSQLPERDIELAYKQFEKRQASEEEKIKLTKELLRKLFSAFVSKKLLSLKEKEPEWILRKHISTKERLPYYEQIYKRILNENKKASIIDLVREDLTSSNANRLSVVDLGAGINGFSYKFFKKIGIDANYIGIESVGQLADLTNFYFKKNKLKANAVHLSLFEKDKVLKLIKKERKPKVVFLFKVIDALEDLKRDYSKELLFDITPLADKVVVSFATKSLGNRQAFKVKRNWILDFIKDNFNILDDFEIGGEHYVVFEKK
jgi:hypothetical protein